MCPLQPTDQYFKSAGMTLSERFTAYQKATEENSTRQKSPEIHRYPLALYVPLPEPTDNLPCIR